jgi:hypothetical protein
MNLTLKKIILQRIFNEFLFVDMNNFIKNFLIGHNNGEQCLKLMIMAKLLIKPDIWHYPFPKGFSTCTNVAIINFV